VDVIESVSDDEKAGKPVPPLVELRAGGPPLEIVEAYPNPLPPPRRPRPFDRNVALAGLQSAFALLTDEELQVARMRMLGAPFLDISEELAMRPERVEKLWKQARRKLGIVLLRTTEAMAPASPEAEGATPA
jgi:DNA-binding CsgD family transcriptional regulator